MTSPRALPPVLPHPHPALSRRRAACGRGFLLSIRSTRRPDEDGLWVWGGSPAVALEAASRASAIPSSPPQSSTACPITATLSPLAARASAAREATLTKSSNSAELSQE